MCKDRERGHRKGDTQILFKLLNYWMQFFIPGAALAGWSFQVATVANRFDRERE